MLKDFDNLNSGARFRRADLHIHSYGASYDVNDKAMSIENIINLCLQENLEVISITDHNNISNVKSAIEFSKSKNILVVPGIEITTTQGHLLLYFPNLKAIESFYGKIDFSDDGKTCNKSISDCLEIANEYNGFGIAAHIDKAGGFDTTIPKMNFVKENIINNKNLLGLEITLPENNLMYTILDENPDRRNLIEKRRKLLKIGYNYEIAKIISSDAHSISALGKNIQGNKKLTRIKMDTLTFESFKLAFLDPIARIRIEDLLPDDIPHFIGMKLEGGFLDGEIVKFSKNLNCIIGGRGAGKSTLFESIRECSGNSSDKKVIDSEVWPDKITLLFQDETKKIEILGKEKIKELSNISNPVNGILNIQIESHGQGDTTETIQHSGKDPHALLKFLDAFAEFDNLKIEDQTIREELFANQIEIERLTIDVGAMKEVEKLMINAQDKVEKMKKENIGEIVKKQESLINEQRFREDLITDLKNLKDSLKSSLTDRELINEVLGYSENVIVGKSEFEKVKQLLSDYNTKLDKVSSSIIQSTEDLFAKIREQIIKWKSNERIIQNEIDKKKKEFEKQGIRLDMAIIRKITKDASDYKTKYAELKKKNDKLRNIKKDRIQIFKRRIEIKKKIFGRRFANQHYINANLKATIEDFNIKVNFQEGLFSPDFESLIARVMQWRTNQVPRATIIASSISPIELLEMIDKKDTSTIEKLTTQNNDKLFTKSDAKVILERLNDIRLEIESVQYEDKPEIKISKNFSTEEGPDKYKVWDFSELSLGQKQSILLSILLFSKNRCPLLIDQPEDNLDSEFIYKTLVRNLRKIKEQRQVIIVTHNANIAVLGDAELIIPLKSTNNFAKIINRGSIDNADTKILTCNILEGSEEAFKRRKEMYSLD